MTKTVPACEDRSRSGSLRAVSVRREVEVQKALEEKNRFDCGSSADPEELLTRAATGRQSR